MARRRFDPTRVPGPEPEPETPSAGAVTEAISVSELAARIAGALAGALPARLLVIGEVGGFRERTHWYFDLKDEQAVVSCVMFAAAARRAGWTPQDGRKVLVVGRVEFYARQGRTQVYVESIEPLGIGELEQRFRALCAELRALGWFDVERKRPIPTYPGRVAVVTSRTGAALQDVLVTMRRRFPAVDVAVVDVRVQGEAAAPEIARAIRWLSQNAESLPGGPIQAIIVTRGGGSLEDLWAFNERVVAEAIFECRVPVVAAIGHETDVTIAELVADERCATPTQAAMRLTPDRAALTEELAHLTSRLTNGAIRTIATGRDRLRALKRRPAIATPGFALRGFGERLQTCRESLPRAIQGRLTEALVRLEKASHRLSRNRPEAVYAARRGILRENGRRLRQAIEARLRAYVPSEAGLRLQAAWLAFAERERGRVTNLARELAMVGPMRVLARGFTVTTLVGGGLVRAPEEVVKGQMIRTRFATGTLDSVVSGAQAGDALLPEPRLESPPPRLEGHPRPKSQSHRVGRRLPFDPGQMDLFGRTR